MTHEASKMYITQTIPTLLDWHRNCHDLSEPFPETRNADINNRTIPSAYPLCWSDFMYCGKTKLVTQLHTHSKDKEAIP